MRTIEEVVEDFRRLTLHPTLIDSLLNEILEIHNAEKRPRGKWENSGIGGCKICTVCNAHMGLSNFKFCPNCGSYNRGDENGDE